MGDFGDKYIRTEIVEARFLDDPETVVTGQGAVNAQSGQYVVRTADGVVVMDGDAFEDTYDEYNGDDDSDVELVVKERDKPVSQEQPSAADKNDGPPLKAGNTDEKPVGSKAPTKK